MKKTLLLLIFFCLNYSIVNAQCTLTARCGSSVAWSGGAGSWTASGTPIAPAISCPSTPSDNTIIIIPACATVDIDINSPIYINMEIYVTGVMNFAGGKKISMCDGYLKVFTGGSLSGGNGGSQLEICAADIYVGGSGGAATGTITSGSYGGATTLLPIELTRFTANSCDKEVCLDWTTLSEKNNDFFTLEKSKDGINFETVKITDGAGNSTTLLNYSATDKQPYSGVSYYRLKQTDFNGAFAYSKLEMVDFNSMNDFSMNVFPNPNDGENINISINANEGEEVLVVVFDAMGREIYSKVIVTGNDGESVYAFDPSEKLTSGIYIVTATSDQKIYSKKLIVK